jgi:hypothetical protein
MGRPTLYRDTFPEIVKAHCLLTGATNEQIADHLGVDIESVKRWMREIPQFRTAVHEGREGADLHVVNALYARAIGYSHDAVHFSAYGGEVIETPYTKHYPPDPDAAKWWLRNRQPKHWRERQELTGAEGGPIVLRIGPVDEQL